MYSNPGSARSFTDNFGLPEQVNHGYFVQVQRCVISLLNGLKDITSRNESLPYLHPGAATVICILGLQSLPGLFSFQNFIPPLAGNGSLSGSPFM